MPELGTYGSEGGSGGYPPVPTRQKSGEHSPTESETKKIITFGTKIDVDLIKRGYLLFFFLQYA
jgi:hypothetical protein